MNRNRQASLGLSFPVSQTWASYRVTGDASELAWSVLCGCQRCRSSINPRNLLFQGVTATDTQRHVTLTQPCLPPARGHMEVCVTAAGTTLRAGTVNGVSCTISGTGVLGLPFRRPASVSRGSGDPGPHQSINPPPALGSTEHMSLGMHMPSGSMKSWGQLFLTWPCPPKPVSEPLWTSVSRLLCRNYFEYTVA